MGGTIYGTEVTAPDGRVWAFKRDGSIRCQKKQNSQIIAAGDEYSVELVTPILTYREDIGTLQELVRRLRKAGMFASPGSGLHIHNDGSVHDARSVRNFLNIIASKNDLLYDALCVEPERTRYCKKLDADLVEWMNRKKPKTMDEIRKIWYEGYHESEHQHYHRSRYQAISLHSLYNRTYTIELRMFNSTFHAGEVRSLIVLALALNHQALTQKCASARKVQADNPKFAFRTYLNRIGLIGASSKTAASIFASICPATARGETSLFKKFCKVKPSV